MSEKESLRVSGQLWPRIMTHIHLKAWGITAFMSLFFVAYLHLLKNPFFPVFQMPLTAIDGWVAFYPPALFFYCSLWVYVSLPVTLILDRRSLFAYGTDIGLLCLLGLLCFLLMPTVVPLPAIDWALHPTMAFLKNVDAAGNACPSLHVATAVFSGFWLDAQLCRLGSRGKLRWANGLWCLAIVYSTLATKQHVALDALAGFLLGASGAWLSLRRAVHRAAP